LRRKDKEITDKKEIERIIRKAEFCRIALADGDTPYIVPMVYGYEDGTIYLHSANEGKKIEILKKNNIVCFEVELNPQLLKRPVACSWSVKYESVIATGRASFITNEEEKRSALACIMRHYSSNEHFDFPKEMLKATTLIKIEIQEIHGKRSLD